MNAKIWVSNSGADFIIQIRAVETEIVEGYFMESSLAGKCYVFSWSTHWHKNVGSISKELLTILLNIDFSIHS